MRYQLNSCYEIKSDFCFEKCYLINRVREDEINKYYVENKLGTRKGSCDLDLFESDEDELCKREILNLVEKYIQKVRIIIETNYK